MGPGNRLNPAKEFRAYRRNLTHRENPGSVYFITFKTAEGSALSDYAKDIAFAGIKFHAGKKYRLYACVVMETHVHCILQPLEAPGGDPYSLAQIMHSIKSYSANRIQRLLKVRGSVWLDESYDRVVRDDEEYLEKLGYVVNNPVKAGLVVKPEDYKWLYCEGFG